MRYRLKPGVSARMKEVNPGLPIPDFMYEHYSSGDHVMALLPWDISRID